MKNENKLFFKICSFVFVSALLCACCLFCVFNDQAMFGDAILLKMAGAMQNGYITDGRKTPEPSPMPEPKQTPKPKQTPEPKPVPRMGDSSESPALYLLIGAAFLIGAVYLLKRGLPNEASNKEKKTS